MRRATGCAGRARPSTAAPGSATSGQFDRSEPVFSACAGAALYRRAAFDDVGRFDEDFFAYLEDVDWSLRAQLLGYSSQYVPAAVGLPQARRHHRRGAQGRYRVMQRRNQIWLVVKSYPAGVLLRRAPGIAGC